MKTETTAVTIPGSIAAVQDRRVESVMSVRCFNPYWLYHGALIPNAILWLGDLSAEAKLLYGKLNDYASNGPNPGELPSQADAAEDMGISQQRLVAIIHELRAYGLIHCDDAGNLSFNERLPCFSIAFGEVEVDDDAA